MSYNAAKIVIIGAGPSGLACGYYLGKQGISSQIIEQDKDVGGLCKTIDYSGYLFDIGGHRFLSKSKRVNTLWKEILGEELLPVERISRIYYKNRFFKYPLSFLDTFWNLGMIESARCIASYVFARITQPGDDTTFEGWITNRFGKRLYAIFFDTYTRKVWAIPPKDISADWAVQRIKGLSLKVALENAIKRSQRSRPKTLSQEFLYPKRGPGQFYDALQDRMVAMGTQVLLERHVIRINCESGKIVSLRYQDNQGLAHEIPVDHLFSSMPLPVLINSLHPEPPSDVREHASLLKFRSFLVVNVILDKEDLFPDQWIYVHTPEVKLGRIQNYKNWSRRMTPNPQHTSLGLEYFCRESDALWEMDDVDLINFAMTELQKIGIASKRHLISGFVLRQSNVYPTYSLGYRAHREAIKTYLEGLKNLQTIGRAGLFRYDNSDLALISGITAATNYLGVTDLDLWELGEEHRYLES